MTPVILFLTLIAQSRGVPNLSVDDRCAVVDAVLKSRAKQGRHVSDKPNVVELSFPEIDFVGRSTTRAANRTIVYPQWKLERRHRPLFATSESCTSDTFIREDELPEVGTAQGDPQGNSDLVVMITLRRVSGREDKRFAFEERLGLSIHARLPVGMKDGGYAVPPAMYRGTVEKTSRGTWIARVEKAIFAS